MKYPERRRKSWHDTKIGITEAGDAGLDLSWEPHLERVDGAILVTKNITPSLYDAALRNKDKVILHATMTGYGSSVLEPEVPALRKELARLSTPGTSRISLGAGCGTH